MTRTRSSSPTAALAIELVEGLQLRFKRGLEHFVAERFGPDELAAVEWLRDEGRHGGGLRYVAVETPAFNRAAINVSHVHYEDEPERKLASASGISTIIHPRDPRAPSVHIHVSWTERKDGRGYWRMMADLNPSNAVEADTQSFAAALREAMGEHYEAARAQGDRYFFIPALERCRGITHVYLEGYASGDAEADRALARRVGQAAIDRYLEILARAHERGGEPSPAQRERQLAYPTLSLLQVLTHDRGTTSGLIVHDQNDLGIMGSLPAFVDRELLASWEPRLPELQRPLLRGIVAALPQGSPSHVSEEVRAELARVLREFYRAHPEAIELQARGEALPPTIDNHRGLA